MGRPGAFEEGGRETDAILNLEEDGASVAGGELLRAGPMKKRVSQIDFVSRWAVLLISAWLLAVLIFFPIRYALQKLVGTPVFDAAAFTGKVLIPSDLFAPSEVNSDIGAIGRNLVKSPFRQQYQRFTSPYPVYVISLESKGADHKRGAHRRLGQLATVVPGIQIPEGLHSHLSKRIKKAIPTPADIGGKGWNNWMRSSPGQIACHFAHLNARKRAYDDGHKYVIIFEDDTSTSLAPTWPMPLERLVELANAKYPQWTAIRLSWWLNLVNFFEKRWTPALHRALTDRARENLLAARDDRNITNHEIRVEVGRIAAELDRTVGNWTADVPVPLLTPSSWGYSGAATLINRKGLQDYLRHYAEDGVIVPPGELQTYDCEGLNCRNDINWKVFKQEGGLSLIVTPPYFVPAMSDTSQMAAIDKETQKEKKAEGGVVPARRDNHIYHMLESSFAIFWSSTLHNIQDFARFFYVKRRRDLFRNYIYWTPVTTKFDNVTWLGEQNRRPLKP